MSESERIRNLNVCGIRNNSKGKLGLRVSQLVSRLVSQLVRLGCIMAPVSCHSCQGLLSRGPGRLKGFLLNIQCG